MISVSAANTRVRTKRITIWSYRIRSISGVGCYYILFFTNVMPRSLLKLAKIAQRMKESMPTVVVGLMNDYMPDRVLFYR